jgi:hypothetical protein
MIALPLSDRAVATDLTGAMSCAEKDSWDNLLLGRGVSTYFKGGD